jgi:excisionase family DNA binding protein
LLAVMDDHGVASPLLLTVRQAAALLALSRSKAYELIAAGELEIVHIDRSARVPYTSAVLYVERLRMSAA